MTDEIDVLRRFRDEMPGPSAGAWARARSAIEAVRSAEGQLGQRYDRDPRHRPSFWIAAAVAGILVVAGGTWAGLAAGRGAPASRTGSGLAAGLTAVDGCPGLEATSGTAVRIRGSRVVLKTPEGQLVTVITRASSTVNRQVASSVRDISDGMYVIVHGTTARGSLAATQAITSDSPIVPPPPRPDRGPGHQRRPGLPHGFAIGTVTAVSAGGFTVVMVGGIDVPVTTSGSTIVLRLARSGVSQFTIGKHIVAFGSAGPDGTLAAASVDQGNQLPQIQRGGSGIARLHSQGCSPAAVATAALLSAG
jgi:hypothetical protein